MDMDVSLLPALNAFAASPPSPPQPVGAPFKMTRDFSKVIDAATVSIDPRIPGTPPAEVLRAVDAAAQRVNWLREHNRELHFIVPPDGGRVQVEVRDLEGRLIREIPPSEALDAMSGGPFE